ncbi:MAG: YiiX/YebB-like N1pC/P60 family cysteine hydrolase [Kangiellaceae bacterium]|jgi:hypothetical protein|nr:YiiX/YebB-like N1pC/P60 family cysteine hydrolase [Kangiellaceae bacterium]
MIKKLKKWAENWLNKEQPVAPFPQIDFAKLKHNLHLGDVILVEGRTRVSEVIKLITQSKWSHAALYIGRLHDIEDQALREKIAALTTFEPSEQLIIEGLLGHGTVINRLTDYQHDNLRICRANTLSHADSLAVVNYAASRVGSPYNVRQLLDLARLLFPWAIVPRRWRSSLFSQNIGESTRTVCSSMLAEAFSEINYPVLPVFKRVGKDKVELIKRNTKLFTPADFDYSPYFKIIKFPFWGVLDKAHYRDLPWNQDGLIAHDQHGLSIEK